MFAMVTRVFFWEKILTAKNTTIIADLKNHAEKHIADTQQTTPTHTPFFIKYWKLLKNFKNIYILYIKKIKIHTTSTVYIYNKRKKKKEKETKTITNSKTHTT